MEKKNGSSDRERSENSEHQATKINGKLNNNVKSVGQECPPHTISIQAVADDNTKRIGEAIEAAFLAKVCKLRIPICKPWGDSERYDFVVDWGKGFWRVQVKGASVLSGASYRVRAGYSGKVFTQEEMDFVVAYIFPLDVWYVVPIESAEGLSTLWFNPRSTRARFEKYREAWCLLDSGRKGGGRGDFPSKCRSEAVKVQCAVCPLRGNVIPSSRGSCFFSHFARS